ncbi:MAG: cytochrome c3 family protein [Candidatus Sulfobium sp.]
MKRAAHIIVCVLLFLFVGLYGCAPKTRYKVLSFFFDGVPNPEMQVKKKDTNKKEDEMARMKAVAYHMHGPYASRHCEGCHTPGSNVLLLPRNKLCFRCHVLDLSKRYVHGPVAAGGCLMCHDPHGSAYPYFLVADPATFCLHCHDKKEIFRNEAHKGIDGEQCTACHDAHSSNKEFLLK